MELTPAEQSVLAFLRNQVDRLQQERHKRDTASLTENQYWHAVEDLKDFTRTLRKEGKNI
ncbi:MAG: hypothetical protein OSA95_06835 [Opitutales bacterium]|nr:hypothetical protein [Opitutales bacterium]